MKKYLLGRELNNGFKTLYNKGKKSNRKIRSIQSQFEHDFRLEEYLNKENKIEYSTYYKNVLNQCLFVNDKLRDLTSAEKSTEERKEIFEELNQEREEDYKEHKGRRRPNNTNGFKTGLIAFSNCFNGDFTEEQKQQIYNENLEYLQKKYGKSLLWVVIHKDETTEHLHYRTLNHDFENHKSFRMTYKKRSEYQTELANANTFLLNNGYTRGESKYITNRDWISIAEGHKEVNREKKQLEKENEILKEKLEIRENKIKSLENEVMSFNNLYGLVLAKKITLEHISRLKEEHKDNKLRKRFLDYRYKILNKIEATEKDLERAEKTLEKIGEDTLKVGTLSKLTNRNPNKKNLTNRNINRGKSISATEIIKNKKVKQSKTDLSNIYNENMEFINSFKEEYTPTFRKRNPNERRISTKERILNNPNMIKRKEAEKKKKLEELNNSIYKSNSDNFDI